MAPHRGERAGVGRFALQERSRAECAADLPAARVGKQHGPGVVPLHGCIAQPDGNRGENVAGGRGGGQAAARPQPGDRRRPPAGAAPPAVSAGRPRFLRQPGQSDSALHVQIPAGGRPVLRESGAAGRAALHRVLRSLRERDDDADRAGERPRAGGQGGRRGAGAGEGSESDARWRQAQRQPRQPPGAECAERAERVQQHGVRGAASRRADRPRQRVDRRRPAQPELRRGRSELRRLEARGAAADDAAPDRDLAGAPAHADGEHGAGARGREAGGRRTSRKPRRPGSAARRSGSRLRSSARRTPRRCSTSSTAACSIPSSGGGWRCS